MKKPVDLRSICESYHELPEQTFEMYKKSLGFEMRNSEIEQIYCLVLKIQPMLVKLNYFYIGYKIPQINKEFDLLRIGDNFILNIELKTSLNYDKALRQLEQNEYYLETLGKSMHLFTFIFEESKLYKLESGELKEAEFESLGKLIESQDIEHLEDIDNLFEPQKYLVSVFNDTDRFMSNQYFLTQQQKDFKNQIIDSKAPVCLIEGKPGTGKSLLLYDVAKELSKKSRTVLIHCGQLNEGHLKLNKEYGWDILSAKDSDSISNYEPKVIFIDEAQRFIPYQLKNILDYIQDEGIQSIMSIDPEQTLGMKEKRYRNKQTILEYINAGVKQFKLSDKIRSNKELHSFVLGILNLGRLKEVEGFKNVSIHYFSKLDSARDFAEAMENEDWQVVDYTGQMYKGGTIEKMKLYMGKNAHEVIGQEFDNVLAVLGSAFYYDESNKLNARNSNYYDTVNMFYQAITRARKKIMLVVVDNRELFTQIMENIWSDS